MNITRKKSKTGRSKTRLVKRNTQPANASKRQWILRLYVAGRTRKCITALHNLKRICEEQLMGKYQIEVIDLSKHPQIAHDDQIVAVPTLVRRAPLPMKNIIGDLSNTERLLVGLDLTLPFAQVCE